MIYDMAMGRDRTRATGEAARAAARPFLCGGGTSERKLAGELLKLHAAAAAVAASPILQRQNFCRWAAARKATLQLAGFP